MNRQSGFSLVEVMIAAGLAVLVIGGILFVSIDSPQTSEDTNEIEEQTTEVVQNEQDIVEDNSPPFEEEGVGTAIRELFEVIQKNIQPSEPTTGGSLVWYQDRDGWKASGAPPACPDPLRLGTPTDLGLVTSVLYPGQLRGGDYKPHGGFRYDNSSSDEITITAPMDAQVVDGGRYFVEGEIQYVFDFIAPCGIWYRFGHLLELSPKFADIVKGFPVPREGDSRTYAVGTTINVVAGEVIATAVGLAQDNNTFVDWGVYDLRSRNDASENPSWAAIHPGDQEQRAVCWFDVLSPADEALVRSLPPADGVSGSTSDYCL